MSSSKHTDPLAEIPTADEKTNKSPQKNEEKEPATENHEIKEETKSNSSKNGKSDNEAVEVSEKSDTNDDGDKNEESKIAEKQQEEKETEKPAATFGFDFSSSSATSTFDPTVTAFARKNIADQKKASLRKKKQGIQKKKVNQPSSEEKDGGGGGGLFVEYDKLTLDVDPRRVAGVHIPKFQECLAANVGVLHELKTTETFADMSDEQQKRFKEVLFAVTMLRKLISEESPHCAPEVCEALLGSYNEEESEDEKKKSIKDKNQEQPLDVLMNWLKDQDDIRCRGMKAGASSSASTTTTAGGATGGEKQKDESEKEAEEDNDEEEWKDVTTSEEKTDGPKKDAVTVLIEETAWLVVNMTSLPSFGITGLMCRRIVDPSDGDNNYCDTLMKMLHWVGSSVEAANNAVWALGNCAGESSAHRDKLISLGVGGTLIDLFRTPTDLSMPKDVSRIDELAKLSNGSLLSNMIWCLSNLVRGKPPVDPEFALQAVPVFGVLMKWASTQTDASNLVTASWGLSYISDGGMTQCQSILNLGILPLLMNGLSSPSNEVVIPCLRTLGSIVTGNDQQTQAVIDAQALPACGFLLSHPKVAIRKEVCWMLSNITAGNVSQIQAVLDSNLVSGILHSCQSPDMTVKKEAAWCIVNITAGGTKDQISFLIAQGILPVLSGLLRVFDPKIVAVALEGVENILQIGEEEKQSKGLHINPVTEMAIKDGIIDQLEALQSHSSTDIYNHAIVILESYFDAEEINGREGEEDVDSNPDNNADGQGYEL